MKRIVEKISTKTPWNLVNSGRKTILARPVSSRVIVDSRLSRGILLAIGMINSSKIFLLFHSIFNQLEKSRPKEIRPKKRSIEIYSIENTLPIRSKYVAKL